MGGGEDLLVVVVVVGGGFAELDGVEVVCWSFGSVFGGIFELVGVY